MARKRRETAFTAPFLKRLSLLPEKMERGWPFNLPLLRGGELEIAWEGEAASVFMTGPATEVFSGRIDVPAEGG